MNMEHDDNRCYPMKVNDVALLSNKDKGDEHKFDGGKRRWDLLPMREVGEIADILTFGAAKYSECGWQKVPNARQRYFSACMRHLTAWFEGEKYDPESGKHHLAHAGCNILFLMWFDRREDVKG